MPALAVLVSRVVAEDVDRRRRTAAAIRASLIGTDAEAPTDAPTDGSHVAANATQDRPTEAGATDVAGTDFGVVRLAAAGA